MFRAANERWIASEYTAFVLPRSVRPYNGISISLLAFRESLILVRSVQSSSTNLYRSISVMTIESTPVRATKLIENVSNAPIPTISMKFDSRELNSCRNSVTFRSIAGMYRHCRMVDDNESTLGTWSSGILPACNCPTCLAICALNGFSQVVPPMKMVK